MTEKKHRYIFARYIQKPRDKSKTHLKGYMSDPANLQWDEIVGFSLGLKNRDKQEAWIIVDIDGQRVVKNRTSDNTDWAQVMDYFLKNYGQQVTDFLKKTGGFTPQS